MLRLTSEVTNPMKFCKAGLLFFILFVLAIPAPAQQLPPNAPSREQVMELFESIQLRRTMEASQEAAMQSVAAVSQQISRQNGRTPDLQTQLQMESLMKGLMEDVRAVLPTDAMLEAIVPIYQRRFTSDEINAIIAFQTSPVGKKMTGLQPAMMQETIQALRPLQEKAMPESMKRLNERVQKLMSPPPADGARD